jgi:hypothetical protein
MGGVWEEIVFLRVRWGLWALKAKKGCPFFRPMVKFRSSIWE